MASHFDIKLRGRLGHEPGDLREMQVLIRIVKVVSDGLSRSSTCGAAGEELGP